MTVSDLPRGAKLMVRVEGEAEKQGAIFHHADGMYSLCTLDGIEGRDGIFHLHHAEEMVAIGDPVTHYELAGAQ